MLGGGGWGSSGGGKGLSNIPLWQALLCGPRSQSKDIPQPQGRRDKLVDMARETRFLKMKLASQGSIREADHQGLGVWAHTYAYTYTYVHTHTHIFTHIHIYVLAPHLSLPTYPVICYRNWTLHTVATRPSFL